MGNELNNAIVTPDFLVYDIDEEKIFPPFLLLILQNEKILNGFSKLSSGTTGRRRLSKEVFEGTKIALPTLKEQKEMMRQILQTEKHIKLLETSLENEKKELLNKVFTENEVN